MTWATLAQVKEEAKITNTNDDALLTRLLAAAQARLEADTDRLFDVSVNTTRYFRINRDVIGRTLWLDRDLCAINTITNGNGVVVTSDQYVTEPRNYAADGYPIYAITLTAYSGVVWQWMTDPDVDQIAVSGKWGYTSTPTAEAIEALIQYAIWLYRRKDATGDSERPLLAGDGTILLPSHIPDFVKVFIESYRFRQIRY
jgi:hypothetical protein